MQIWSKCLQKHGDAKITSSSATDETRAGAAYALAAYTFWGVAPIYFVWVRFAEPLEVLAHRITWSIPLLLLLITAARQWPIVAGLTTRQVGGLLACSVLLSINWLTFIYAIFDGKIAETALGYFINPLVSMVLGAVLLAERLRTLQWVAAGIAAAGVINELIVQGTVPVYALLLAASFGVYGLLKKRLALPSSASLGVETLLIAPIALGYLFWFTTSGASPPRTNPELSLLALGGVVTVLPLVWFGAAAVRLPLTILGFFQYLAPSISLLIAVFMYGESVTFARWTAFVCVWIGLALISVEGLVHARRKATGS